MPEIGEHVITRAGFTKAEAVRYGVALALVAGAAVAYAFSIFGAITLCRQQIAQVGTTPVVRVCSGLQPLDFLPLAVLLVLLLVPDYIIRLPGGTGVERRDKRNGHIDISPAKGLPPTTDSPELSAVQAHLTTS